MKGDGKMSRAIVVAFHKYTPFGDEFYEPIFNFFLVNLGKYQDEFDSVYIVDSTWNIKEKGFNFPEINTKNINPIKVIKVSPHLRYYDAYKEVLPKIKEDLVLFIDNDTIVYKKGIIKNTFHRLEKEFPIVSIMDTIGTWKTDKLLIGNKFCPYFFAAHKDFLLKYQNIEWGPEMPDFETLGRLTKSIIEDGFFAWEMPDDKTGIYFDGTKDGEKGKDLGYYHIRSGSTPAYLLATKYYGNKKTYEDYLKNQPAKEYVRQLAWYWYMWSKTNEKSLPQIMDIILDSPQIEHIDWDEYLDKFIKYHNLL